jgi:plastocyanin
MRKGSRRIAALVSVALLAAALVGTAGTAKAQGELDVLAGFPLASAGAPSAAEGMRFYAPELNVHQGDVINFLWRGFHSAALLPVNEDADTWVDANASQIGQPFFLLTEDPDDTGLDTGSSASKPAVKINNAVAFPSFFTCGSETSPCTYDGSFLNSGLPIAEDATGFSTEIDAAPGSSFWVVCLLHPNMRLKVNVVAGSDPATTQDEVDDFADTAIAQDASESSDLHKQLQKPRKQNGVWQAHGGADGDGFALLAMYPKKLTIRKGDRVRWRFDRLPFELHTVSFPFNKAAGIIQNDFLPACDPDGDAGAGPDGPPENETTICNDPSQVEIEFEPRTIYQYGDGKFNGNDFETSGVRGDFGLSTDPYTLKFTKTSNKKGFRYLCMIHGGFMDGRVVVKPKKK